MSKFGISHIVIDYLFDHGRYRPVENLEPTNPSQRIFASLYDLIEVLTKYGDTEYWTITSFKGNGIYPYARREDRDQKGEEFAFGSREFTDNGNAGWRVVKKIPDKKDQLNITQGIHLNKQLEHARLFLKNSESNLK